MANIRGRDIALVLAMFVLALPAELETGFAGQAAVSVIVWAIMSRS